MIEQHAELLKLLLRGKILDAIVLHPAVEHSLMDILNKAEDLCQLLLHLSKVSLPLLLIVNSDTAFEATNYLFIRDLARLV